MDEGKLGTASGLGHIHRGKCPLPGILGYDVGGVENEPTCIFNPAIPRRREMPKLTKIVPIVQLNRDGDG